MSDGRRGQTATATVGEKWGHPISEARQTELRGYLDRWAAETDHDEREGPFDRGLGNSGVSLTGADVAWLAKMSQPDLLGALPNLHLERANLSGAHLHGAF